MMPPLRGKSTYPGCSDFWNHLFVPGDSVAQEILEAANASIVVSAGFAGRKGLSDLKDGFVR